MTDDFKKWVYLKAGMPGSCEADVSYFSRNSNAYEMLIKAMWAINRDESIYSLTMNIGEIEVYHSKGYIKKKHFYFEDHNNSELEALTEALEHVYENTK